MQIVYMLLKSESKRKFLVNIGRSPRISHFVGKTRKFENSQQKPKINKNTLSAAAKIPRIPQFFFEIRFKTLFIHTFLHHVLNDILKCLSFLLAAKPSSSFSSYFVVAASLFLQFLLSSLLSIFRVFCKSFEIFFSFRKI